MLYIILIALMLITSFMTCMTTNMQATTLYIGKILATPEELTIEPRGYQDAITPKFQERLLLIYPILSVSVLALGIYIKWYVGIIAILVLFFFLNVTISYCVPRNIAFYMRFMEIHIANKMANYKKENDYARAEAAEYVMNKLFELHQSEVDNTIIVPTMAQARNL